jgi:hypothetical protein
MSEDCKTNLMKTHDSKSHWNASLPYPSWPFGTVCPKELAKWARQNLSSDKLVDSYEEALV